jgi:hypothetical protein
MKNNKGLYSSAAILLIITIYFPFCTIFIKNWPLTFAEWKRVTELSLLEGA